MPLRHIALCCLLTATTGQGFAVEPLAFDHWGVHAPTPADDPSGDAAPASDPASYPLAEEFAARRELVIRALAEEDLAKWRRGWFTGGDPGKYLPGAAMAKLLVDPDDAMARSYMNDDRSYKEHYHFAAVNWARFLPQFRGALTDETFERLKERAAATTDYLSAGGTENHKTMWFTGPLVLPWYLDGGLGRKTQAETLAHGKEWIRDYVRTLYHHGMGEWESATYHVFTINGFLNVYDYAQDPEVRLIAKAGLDFLVGAYATKYTDGVLAGPTQRGYGTESAGKLTDQTGWLWWGASRVLSSQDVRDFRYTSHAWTSRWRPNRVLTNIALANLPDLPTEWRNGKANYWFGQKIPPRSNQRQETVFKAADFTLGSLWSGYDPHGQTTRWQLTARGRDGAITLTGGHPFDGRWYDGLGAYEQTAQIGSSLVLMADIPAEDSRPYTFVHIPKGARWPEFHDGWWVMRAHHCWIGIRPLVEDSEIVLRERSPKERQRGMHPSPIIHIPGRRSGFVLQVGSDSDYPDEAAFRAALATSAVTVHDDDDGWRVALITLDGRQLTTRHQPGQARLRAEVEGKPVVYEDWPVFGGPWFRVVNGVLSAYDGEAGYRVDFTGELPVYSSLDP